MRMKRLHGFLTMVLCISLLLATLIFNTQTANAAGTVYYVDPVSGNDANSGTSTSSPWKTIPGTRTANDSGWLRSTWGSKSSTNKLQPGDIIEIKADTSMTSSIGGRLKIDSTFYSTSSSSNTIIRVSSTWGSGNFTYNGSGMSVASWEGLIQVTVSYLSIEGAGSDRRFIVSNSSGWYGIEFAGSSSSHLKSNVLDYIEVAYPSSVGCDFSYADDWTVSNSSVHNGSYYGFAAGGGNDANCNNGTYIDCESYGITGDDQPQGYQYVGCTSITYLRCKAHNSGRDGFDGGVIYDGSASSATYINCSSYDNGEDGFGTNGGNVQDVVDLNKSTYINCVAYNNGQAGWDCYSGVTSYIYHCVAHNNGPEVAFAGNFLIYSGPQSITRVTMRNCIAYKPKYHANVYVYTEGVPDSVPTYIYSDYNIFVPRSSDLEVFFERWGNAVTYNDPRPSWVGAHDKVGIAYNNVNFTAVSTASFAANDYRLLTNSCAINAGTYLSSPTAVLTDRDGVTRSNPPEIGMYEYGGGTPTPTPTPPPSTGLITNLVVNDSTNASDWSIQTNLSIGNTQYGDRTYTLASVPSSVAGNDWIRPACDSKAYTGTTLCTFKVNANSDVYIASDDRISSKPSWMTGWTDTGENMTSTDANPALTYSLYKKSYTSGSTVSLGNNGDTTSVQYLIIVKRNSIISNLTVNDSANTADWSLQSLINPGLAQYGDRTYTLASVPSSVAGSDWIRPACDSKTYTGTTLCTFVVSTGADVYVASDDRITTKPSWMSGWTDTGENITSTDANPALTYSLFKKSYTTGSTVSLGNNGDTTSVQYLIIAKPNGGTPTPTPTPTPVNVALGKVPTTNGSFDNLPASAITDGQKNDTNQYTTVDENPRWIEIDLGQSYNVNKINVWHYFGDGRTYHDVIVQLSNISDFSSGVTTVFNNDTNNSAGQGTGSNSEYAESSSGKVITFSPVNARYVRLWTNGSTVNIWGHYVEVEVWK